MVFGAHVHVEGPAQKAGRRDNPPGVGKLAQPDPLNERSRSAFAVAAGARRVFPAALLRARGSGFLRGLGCRCLREGLAETAARRAEGRRRCRTAVGT